MAKVEIKYQCGCGLTTQSVKAAVEHADEKGHIMTVSGMIKPEVDVSSPKA